MDLPRVVIVNDSAFHRRLMSDVVQCNEMRAETCEGEAWIDEIASPEKKPSVVVVDLDLPRSRGIRVVQKLRALPGALRPRIIGLSRSVAAGQAAVEVEQLISGPLDVGGFARSVVEQAREARALDA